MRSVEFLVAVFLLLWLFSFLYQDAQKYVASTETALETFNQSLRVFEARSIISSLIAYGSPFEYSAFGKIDPNLIGIEYDPATGTYRYLTYSRW